MSVSAECDLWWYWQNMNTTYQGLVLFTYDGIGYFIILFSITKLEGKQ